MDKNELLKQIMAVDLSAFDLQLYLNTHPRDQRALMAYRNYIQQSAVLKREYQMKYSALTPGFAANSYPWSWIDNPWPWERQ